MGIIAWILLGLFAGAIARTLVPGRTEPGGCIGTTAIGILGALLGGLLASALVGDPAADHPHDLPVGNDKGRCRGPSSRL
jgi:uncharacterized membrane protein YeaQ/YmgE (transglycosylase-associated protein family)